MPYVQVKLPSNAGGELKYIEEIGWWTISWERWTTPFTSTNRHHLTYEDVDKALKWTDRKGNNCTGGTWLLTPTWSYSMEVGEGIDTVTLIGMRTSTKYRVGFWQTGTSNFDIPYKVLRTRGIRLQIYIIP